MKIEEELNLVTSRPLFRFATLALLFAGSSPNRAHAQMPTQTSPQPQSRIVSQIKNEERVSVKGTTSPYLQASVDSGRLAGGKNLGRMLLMLTATPEQEQAADELLASQHDGSSALYHKWLTPAQYGQQFGATAEDAVKVQRWLEQEGLTVHGIAQSRRFVVFSGTVGQVEQAFSTEMHSYTHNGKSFISNSTDVQIPAALLPA